MKAIINLTLILIYINISSQITVPLTENNLDNLENGNYIKDINGHFDKFIGVWKYTNVNEEFIVKIYKNEHVATNTYYIDRLCGGYKYIKDGIVKVDRLNVQCTDLTSPQNLGFFGGSSLSNNYQKVGLPGSDEVGKRLIRITLEAIPNTDPPQLKWSMRNRENWVINDQGFKQGTGAGLPNDIILIKQ